MPFSNMKFNDQELAVLQTAVDVSCLQLGVSRSDTAGRESIAKAIIALAEAGQFSPVKLVNYAIADYEKRPQAYRWAANFNQPAGASQ